MKCACCFDNPSFPLFLAGKHKRLRQQTCAFLWQRSLSATNNKYLGKKAMKFTWLHTHTHSHLTLDSSGCLHIYHFNLFVVAFGCILGPSSSLALKCLPHCVLNIKKSLKVAYESILYIYTAWYHTHSARVCAPGAAHCNFSIFSAFSLCFFVLWKTLQGKTFSCLFTN